MNKLNVLSPVYKPMVCCPDENKEMLLSKWDLWQRQYEPGEHRDIAIGILTDCLNRKAGSVDLSALGLKSLPELPSSIEYLNINDNNISYLSGLPENLRIIHANNNSINEIEYFPANLECVELCNNKLTHLPPLPGAMKRLIVEDNQLVALPKLPECIEVISVCRNQIEIIEDNLPSGLVAFYAAENKIHCLPQNIPPGISKVSFSKNNIKNITDHIFSLNPESVVYIKNNPLDEDSLSLLNKNSFELSYKGPTIYYHLSNDVCIISDRGVRPLNVLVAGWYPPKERVSVAIRWQKENNVEYADVFKSFILRLYDTVNSLNDDEFSLKVSSWLSEIDKASELKKQSFCIAYDATETCEDRVSLTWNHMQRALKVYKAENGEYDDSIPSFFNLAKEMFRIEVLEEISHAKVKELNAEDEIEVWLALQCKLSDVLKLSTAVKDMRYFNISNITQDDIDNAENIVKAREKNDFPSWFSKWQPWHSVIKRIAPKRYERTMEELYTFLEKDFPSQLSYQLSKQDLLGDADAERQYGVYLMSKFEDALYKNLTFDVLNDYAPDLAGMFL
ncbi:hypothetical protein F6T13_22015 [Escherichia coli]|nr:hypothetical protein [Escherichia coli]EGF7413082.1 hypothetical protein [Escherichia coli]EGF7454209.1 hypothetical protein [Escherichia coli]